MLAKAISPAVVSRHCPLCIIDPRCRMKTRFLLLVAVGCVPVVAAAGADWPQWRGPNRDAKAMIFSPPSRGPKELKKKGSFPGAKGPATPALVGDKLYAF